jgi:exonuclease III
MRLKIFSYNIRGLPFFPDSWSNPLADWFNNTDYDCVCLQEVFTEGRIKMLTDSLKKNGYTVIKPNDFAKRYNLMSSGLLTAVKTERWSILEEGFHFYEHSTVIENITNKGFHWLKVTEKNKQNKQNKPILLINTHMQADHSINLFSGCIDTRPIRKKQAEQILKLIEHVKTNHLIIGDINCEIEPHNDFLYLTGRKTGIQKHTFICTGEDLDHVAYIPKIMPKRPIVKEVSVLSKLWWSDHWPIFVIVELPLSIDFSGL